MTTDSPTLISSLLRLSAHHLALSFSTAAPKIWNSLPLSLRTCTVYWSWHLPSSSQDPLLPAGLPLHLTPLLLRTRFSFCWPLCAFINYICILTYLFTNKVRMVQWMVVNKPWQIRLWVHPTSRASPSDDSTMPACNGTVSLPCCSSTCPRRECRQSELLARQLHITITSTDGTARQYLMAHWTPVSQTASRQHIRSTASHQAFSALTLLTGRQEGHPVGWSMAQLKFFVRNITFFHKL